MAARGHGARAVHVQHGAFLAGRFGNYFCNDLLLVWGEDSRRAMTECGIDDDQLKVVGATIYDELARDREGSGSRGFPRPGEPLEVAFMASRTGGSFVSYPLAKLCLLVVAKGVEQIPNPTDGQDPSGRQNPHD